MAYKRLFIWVEGGDDELFFNRVLKPLFEKQYDLVEVRTYAQKSKHYLDNFITSINAIPDSHYILITDINSSPCITHKKQTQLNKYKRLEADNIIVVVQEIESWYRAGVDEAGRSALKLSDMDSSDSLTKEQFNNLIPQRFTSRLDFLLELLKYYSLDVGAQKNQSLKYFVEKYLT